MKFKESGTKRYVMILVNIFFVFFFLALTVVVAEDWMPKSWPDDKVVIQPNIITMPPEHILLVRKQPADYCAVILRNFKYKQSKKAYKWYSEYVSYYQTDIHNGLFDDEKIEVEKDELSTPTLWGIGRLTFRLSSPEIKCGPIKLMWLATGNVCFSGYGQKQGDHGVEMAPTNWTDISEVNFSDPRIKWYKYDSKRERHTININEVWTKGDTKKEKEVNVKENSSTDKGTPSR